MTDRKQINFTIVPEDGGTEPRTYANFCAVNHTPFDFTLTFCEVMPLSEKEIRDAEAEHVVRAPIRAPSETWQKCQMRAASPMSTPSSTMAVE